MKSLQELYDEILASDELKQEFAEAAKSEETTATFLKSHDCDASVSDLAAFLKEQLTEKKELGEQEVEQVAGGGAGTGIAVFTSALIAIICAGGAAIIATISAVHPDAKGVSDCFNTANDII